MFVFLQVEHAVEASVDDDDDDASLPALDEDDSVDEDDNSNASVIFFIVLKARTFRSLHDFASDISLKSRTTTHCDTIRSIVFVSIFLYRLSCSTLPLDRI